MLKFSLLTYIADELSYYLLQCTFIKYNLHQLNKCYRIEIHSIYMINTTIVLTFFFLVTQANSSKFVISIAVTNHLISTLLS